MISPNHINQFLSHCVNMNWAGVFYSPPHQQHFNAILHDLNIIKDLGDRYFIFHPFDQTERPIIKIRPDFLNEEVIDKLNGLLSDSSKGWQNSDLINEQPTEFNQYQKQFNQYQEILKEGRSTKAILSTLVLEPMDQHQVGELLFSLRQNYPQAFIYILSTPFAGTWLGATPEIFLRFNGSSISTMSLAGTKRISDKVGFGEKEFNEQKIVTDYICTLFENEFGNVSPQPVSELVYGDMIHVLTSIDSDLPADITVHGLMEFASRYHPTPAVGGYPKEEACRLIKNVELHSRYYYSGFMGFVESNQFQLMVNLRCMALANETAFIFAGGGITIDSILEMEWEETRLKAASLLKLLKPA